MWSMDEYGYFGLGYLSVILLP